MDREELLKQIKQTIREAEPDAEIILYGSLSRGDAVRESDWDLLILVDGHLYNDLFERRQEGDYIDFVSFKESQVVP